MASETSERINLTPEQEELETKATELLDRLAEAGWDFVGSGPNISVGPEGQISTVFWLETGLDLQVAQMLVSNLNPEELDQLAGWTVIEDDEAKRVVLDYEGPVDADFEEVVDRMVALVQ